MDWQGLELEKMMIRRFLILLTLGLLISACEKRSQEEVLSSVDGMSSAEDVKNVLGTADKISNIGSTEIWKYNSDPKDVCFAVAGDTIIKFSCI